MSALGVVLFIIGLAVMILVHEWGHYMTAKRFGMKVEAFFIGFGPRLWSIHRGETEYGVRAFPLGGYVKIGGMNPFVEVPESDKSRSFGAKPRWQRAIVLVAGSAMNILLGLFILVIIFGAIGIPFPSLEIAELTTGEDGEPLPAAEAGLQPGDQIVEIDGRAVSEWEEFRALVRANPENEISIGVERAGERVQVIATPMRVVEELPDGTEAEIGFLGLSPDDEFIREPPHVAVWSAVRTTGDFISLSVTGIVEVFGGDGIRSLFTSLSTPGEREPTEDALIGPVGAGRIAGQVAQQSLIDLLFFIVGVSIFLGVINLYPVPVLDGGYLALLAFEGITRRDVNFRKLVPIWVVFFGLLMFLFAAILFLDIFRPINLQ